MFLNSNERTQNRIFKLLVKLSDLFKFGCKSILPNIMNHEVIQCVESNKQAHMHTHPQELFFLLFTLTLHISLIFAETSAYI